MFAQQISHPGDSAGVAVYGRNGLRTENLGVFGSGDAQALFNVALRFLDGELTRLGTQRNALPKLAQLRPRIWMRSIMSARA